MTDKMYATICLCLVLLVACGTEHTLSDNNGYYAIRGKYGPSLVYMDRYSAPDKKE